MTAHPILGTGVFLLGGVAAALYLLPFRAVKGWRYETGWLVSVLAGWLVLPLAFDVCVIPDLRSILAQGGGSVFARTFGFGALWGVGALCWALMVRYLGVGLGLGIGAGICAATGTLLPPIVAGNAASLVAALVAGFASAGINFGLQGAPGWERAALEQGVNPLWAGMPVLTVVLWGGVATQLAWVGGRRRRGRRADAPVPGGEGVRAGTVWKNALLSASVGVIGVLQFFTQKVGEPLMGEARYISFAVLMASAIFFSTGVGLALGEWRGTRVRTRLVLAAGLAALVASFALISAGSR